MRIVFVHPNYHSGGAEIAGTWPPAWVAYLTGHLRRAGFDDIHFIDAMTHHVDHDALRAALADLKPDVVGTTAITPAIYEAEEVLKIAKEVAPNALRVLGGIHGTFMFRQVLSEAPWIDVIVRGEGEEIMTALMTALRDGRWPADRARSRARLSWTATRSSTTPPPARSRIWTGSTPTGRSWNGTIHLHPAGREASPSRTWRAAARSPVRSARNGSSGATTACATRKRWPTRSSGW
jgi:hypothetical protein